MKLVLISDTHGMHNRIEDMPNGDILIHAGDFSVKGTIPEIASFNHWLSKQDYSEKIVIAGNHDIMFQTNPLIARSILTECTYLEDSSVVIDGIKFYGSPWTPMFRNWAFNLERGEEIDQKWKMIPDDTNVLITHGPPMGILDQNLEGEYCGCERLFERVQQLTKLKYHIVGHIHEGYGMYNDMFINASICTRFYKPTNKPIVVEI